MSVHVIAWVLAHSDARLGDRLVLITLADHAGKDGTGAWPTVMTIAHEARMSERAVQYSLRRLEAAGAIVKTSVSRAGTAVYTVQMHAKSALLKQDSAPLEVQNLRQGGAKHDEIVSDFAPEPSLTVIEEDPLPPEGGSDNHRRTTSREEALRVACPKCHAPIGSSCRGTHHERLSMHAERHDTALAAGASVARSPTTQRRHRDPTTTQRRSQTPEEDAYLARLSAEEKR